MARVTDAPQQQSQAGAQVPRPQRRERFLAGPARWLTERLSPTVRQTLGLWFASRLAMIVTAASVGWLFAVGPVQDFGDRWVQWDVRHILAIAVHGYRGDPTGVPNEAFFPGLPALMWLGDKVLPLGLTNAGLVVSLVAGAVAAVALGQLGDLEYGPGAGARTVLLWVLAPTAVFLAAPYTESLFLGCAIPAWLLARRGRWMEASILAGAAMTVRASGVFLAVALLVEFATSPRRRWDGLPWLLLPWWVLFCWVAYLRSITGSWTAWVDAQAEGWYRGFTWPWESLSHTWSTAFGGRYPPDMAWMFRAELVAMLVGVALTGWLLARRRWGEATWIGMQVAAFATSYWFISLPRATLLWWPLWMALAAVTLKYRWTLSLYVAIAGPLSIVWATSYLTGRWAG
jgi:hypothetical protein